jgi:hypothetical protein
MSIDKVRIIELPLASTIGANDFIAIDNDGDGTRKISAILLGGSVMAFLAPIYSASTNYILNDVVLHDNKLYKNIFAITGGGESWNPAHWMETTIGAVVESKVDKVEGKTLTENDFTNALLNKLNGIETGANVNVINAVLVDGTALPVSDKKVNIIGKANQTEVAKAYSTNVSYQPNDYVIYNNALYVCTGATSGAWNSSKWSQVAVGDELADIRGDFTDLANSVTAMVGTPLVASNTSQMTDHTKIYVYTGSQSGYTYGHWYYWNGSAWTDGGAYTTGVADNTMSTSSTNPVQNKIVTGHINNMINLYSEEPPNTAQTISYTDGIVSQVVHKSGGTTIRTDTYTYGSNTFTEVRTLNTGAKLTIVTNLTTYESTTTYVSA